jgi:Endopolygalacturonase
MTKYLLCLAVVVFCSFSAFSQNKFEGYNVVVSVPTNHRQATCAVRFAPPTTQITVTDLDRATPLKLNACGGTGTSLVNATASNATFRINPSTYKWCFEGEDKNYRIAFEGDQHSGPVTYNWPAEPDPRNAGFYNIRDFGAVGDGKADDTIAIKSAMAYVASKNGGIVRFPEGEYRVTETVALPSAVTIEGTNGLPSNVPTSILARKNPSSIRLSGSGRALFRIGECTSQVAIRDIELIADSNQGTYGIEAVGAYNSAQGLLVERSSFSNFDRGIYAYGLPQTDLNWQIDYVKIKDSTFMMVRDAGIYTNSRNSDWKVIGTVFINPKKGPGQNANSMKFERAAGILIQDTFGGGFPSALGGTFLDVLDSGGITIISSSTEAMTNSIVINSEMNPLAGNYSGPITMINSAFGDPIIFNARRTLVSTGNGFGAKTFKADAGVRIYSTGDRFCFDGYILGCRGEQINLFDKATVVFMTGQPGEGQLTGHPTMFGTDVRFDSLVQMPSLQHNALPTGRANGTFVLCANCRRDTTPCQPGGSGAPAMVVGNQWSCL